jgi:alkanesulfonate monooxygenase SsuD/methylene tetrahydromethanopterin reductase-like flavin-dependent oxidoreductase (luciferase family)
VDNIEAMVPPGALAMVEEALSVTAVGAPETVERQLGALIDRYRPDEVILTGQIHDPAARKHSFGIAARAMKALGSVPA